LKNDGMRGNVRAKTSHIRKILSESTTTQPPHPCHKMQRWGKRAQTLKKAMQKTTALLGEGKITRTTQPEEKNCCLRPPRTNCRGGSLQACSAEQTFLKKVSRKKNAPRLMPAASSDIRTRKLVLPDDPNKKTTAALDLPRTRLRSAFKKKKNQSPKQKKTVPKWANGIGKEWLREAAQHAGSQKTCGKTPLGRDPTSHPHWLKRDT